MANEDGCERCGRTKYGARRHHWLCQSCDDDEIKYSENLKNPWHRDSEDYDTDDGPNY